MGQKHNYRLRAAFHWLLALLVLTMLGIGFFWLRPMPNSDPDKLKILALHMAGGAAVATLLLVRPTLRFGDFGRPNNRKASVVHALLYALVSLLIASGIWTALAARIPKILLHGTAADLPRFTALPAFIAHTLVAELLTLLVGLHIAAALFQQFVLKGGLLSSLSGSAPDGELAERAD